MLSCVFSGPRLHQGCLPRPCTSDVPGGGQGGQGLLAARSGVRAAEGRGVPPWTHPYAPAVPREARRRRISLHGLRALRGGLVRVCPAIQRLPVCLHGGPGGTEEFLRLPFGLRKRVLAPRDSRMAASISSRDEAVKLVLKSGHIRRSRGGQTAVTTHGGAAFCLAAIATQTLGG